MKIRKLGCTVHGVKPRDIAWFWINMRPKIMESVGAQKKHHTGHVLRIEGLLYGGDLVEWLKHTNGI